MVPSLETIPSFAPEEGKGAGISSAHPEHGSQTIAPLISAAGSQPQVADQPDARIGQDLEPPAFIVSEPSCLPCNL